MYLGGVSIGLLSCLWVLEPNIFATMVTINEHIALYTFYILLSSYVYRKNSFDGYLVTQQNVYQLVMPWPYIFDF